jgi:hypothetical protein
MNSKRRVIHMTADGKYVAVTDGGKKVYNPKAHFVKSPGGGVHVVSNSTARVPTKIRKVAVRKPRANRGAARAPRANVYGLRGRPPKAGGPKKYVRKEGLRKVRSNKGQARKKKDPMARLIASLN